MPWLLCKDLQYVNACDKLSLANTFTNAEHIDSLFLAPFSLQKRTSRHLTYICLYS